MLPAAGTDTILFLQPCATAHAGLYQQINCLYWTTYTADLALYSAINVSRLNSLSVMVGFPKFIIATP